MSSGMIDLEVRIDRAVEVSVHVSDIVHELNELPLVNRWNAITTILNHIDLNDQDELEPHQKEIIIQWIKSKIKTFNIND